MATTAAHLPAGITLSWLATRRWTEPTPKGMRKGDHLGSPDGFRVMAVACLDSNRHLNQHVGQGRPLTTPNNGM